MHRWIGVCLAVAGALVVPRTAISQNDPRPNFVIVLVDDLRWDALPTSGHPFIESPNLERIAREGAVFDNAFVTTPLCSPSRASFLTGQYVRNHGVVTNGFSDRQRPRFEHFPALLEAVGYDTGFVGKWHMGEDGAPRRGFTHWVGFGGQGTYRNPHININGRKIIRQGYLTDVLNELAVDFVRTAARGVRPFLLYLSHKAVHEPFDPARRHQSLYERERLPQYPGEKDTLEGKLALTRDVPNDPQPPVIAGRGGPSDGQIRRQLALLAAVDDGIGHIVKTLREEGVLNKTVIIFTSDNGFFHGEHGLGDKRWPYDEALRIPFVLRYPPLVSPDTRVSQLVLNIDLAPTVLELAGGKDSPVFDGQSVVPLLRGEAEGWRRSFVAEYFRERPFPRIPNWNAVRAERYKYIQFPDLGPLFDELYDLRADPHELDNRIHDAELQAVLESLRAELVRFNETP